MVQRLAKAKTELADTLPGHRPLFESKAALLSSEVGFLRRRLSFTAVQEQSRLLLDRMQLLGDEAKEARRRREWAEQAARVQMRERRAQVTVGQEAVELICKNVRKTKQNETISR